MVDLLTSRPGTPRERADSQWQYVHCTVCQTNFQRENMTLKAGPKCTVCGTTTLKPGKFTKDVDNRESTGQTSDDLPSAKQTQPRGRDRSPRASKEQRAISMPPQGSSFQSILKSAMSMLPKTVSITKDSPTRFSPEQPRMSDESDSAATEFYPDQDTGKAPK